MIEQILMLALYTIAGGLSAAFMLAGYALFALMAYGIIKKYRGRHRTIYQP